MKKKMRGAGIALMLAGMLALTGCSGRQIGNELSVAVLPTPEETAPVAPLGDANDAGSVFLAKLYYVNVDGTSLVPVTRTIWLRDGKSIEEAIVEELINPPGISSVTAVAPSETKLLSIEKSGPVVTVNLSLDARGLATDQQMMWLNAAITNSLTELDGIEKVNVLVGGRSEAVAELPVGTSGRAENNLTTMWVQVQTENDRFLESVGETRVLERDVTLYFPSLDGNYLVPEVRQIRFTVDNYAVGIMAQLQAGPSRSDCLRRALPDNEDILLAPPAIVVGEDGKRILEFNFAATLPDEVDADGTARWQFCASLALTMTTFIPELDGVRILIDGAIVTSVPDDADGVVFEGGIIQRADFAGQIGSIATLYFGLTNGALAAESRVTTQLGAENLRALVDMLIAGSNKSLQNVFPDGVQAADVLGVLQDGDVALLNFSSNFYRLCQSLGTVAERQLIYSVVNTLTELPGINGVRFYIDGALVDTLSGTVYLRSRLLRNPGLLQAQN